MEYVLGFAVLAIVVWVMFLRSAGTASGEAIGGEFNEASQKIQITLGELIREVSKAEPERLSNEQFHRLVEAAADDFSRYAQIAHLIGSKVSQAEGRTTKPLADFLAISTPEFATAIGTSIERRDPTALLQVMEKYGIKNAPV